MSSSPRPIVLSGPSGTGKSTLLKRLLADHPNSFGFSVSNTTRAPRAGEVDGKDYNFLTKEQFTSGIEKGAYIEHAQFSGNYYGTTIAGVQAVSKEAGRKCILDIDSQGVLLVKKTNLNARYLFVAPPSMEELERRLRSRKTDSNEAIEKRLAAAKGEMELSKQEGVHDLIIVNDDLDKAYVQLEDFCLRDD
ncbi:Guanylate kinase [Taphrina deformans PYCC 5710]|uniref:Guanylate kinase n=1 Tax=Taphrina deformans (strain PYCC 5710 / ATCC 11124 / CBS 356.35 / IMI 108563 / JCM 9778 / NBRC 8474) TaxID=1097556 RepID=R4X9Q1_TAPDE|nr:Guanylate kinase [Taphrina deformans PYCC 5710]|eukprot:CCG82496.1 Guanylate kinase [Taphrina deformans PYCC 5710]